MYKSIPVTYENNFGYNIIITDNFSKLASNINVIKPKKYDKICIFTDDNVSMYHLEAVQKELKADYSDVIIFTMPSGEENKQLSVVEKLYEYLIGNHFTRNSLLIALGGGVVGDMCGFAAATFLRGIDFIQIPTTLLSQVDSSIGGKTGVDLLSYKNMIGAFYMPRLVYINLRTLQTLPDEQLACGMGEVIKYGLIMNKEFYRSLFSIEGGLDSLSDDDIFNIVTTCILCKRKIVQEDPKEQGVRAFLNFGHTIGHAVEKLCNFKLYHGQCVGLGMISSMYLSNKLRGEDKISSNDIDDLKLLLEKYNLLTTIPKDLMNFKNNDVINAMKSDKKVAAGKIKFVILDEIGRANIYTDFTKDDFSAAIDRII